MDLHALTSKFETPAKQLETPEVATQPEPALESVAEPMEKDTAPSLEKIISSPEPSTPERPAKVGEETMSTESLPSKNQNVHDAIFWDVHIMMAYYIILSALTAWLLPMFGAAT
ncbi:MAG TPA: hypothetical protein VK206_28230 [Anaerolineales bacterium]|nr:hypothetical protein [Anaerolineales bacterium]